MEHVDQAKYEEVVQAYERAKTAGEGDSLTPAKRSGPRGQGKPRRPPTAFDGFSDGLRTEAEVALPLRLGARAATDQAYARSLEAGATQAVSKWKAVPTTRDQTRGLDVRRQSVTRW